MLIIVGLALAVLIITAFGSNDDAGTDDRPVAPELDSQMRDGNCFIFVGESIRIESCSSGRAEAEVVEIVPNPGNCPANTENIRQGDLVLCYQRLVPGSVNVVPSE